MRYTYLANYVQYCTRLTVVIDRSYDLYSTVLFFNVSVYWKPFIYICDVFYFSSFSTLSIWFSLKKINHFILRMTFALRIFCNWYLIAHSLTNLIWILVEDIYLYPLIKPNDIAWFFPKWIFLKDTIIFNVEHSRFVRT